MIQDFFRQISSEQPESEDARINAMNDDEMYKYFTEIDMKEHKKKHGLD